MSTGMTADPVASVNPIVGDSASGRPATAEDERRMWEERRAASAEARGAEGEDAADAASAQASDNGTAVAVPAPLPPAGPHPLETGWALWEHRAADARSQTYEQNMAKLIEFSSIEDFWRAWNNIPKPSDIFFDGKANKKVGDRVIESLSLFRAGIKPEWEDKANRAGGELFIRKSMPLPYLDDVWKKLVLSMIGEILDSTDEIAGARVVDKSSRGKSMYRLELWYKSKSATDPLQVALHNALNDPKKPFVWEYRSHS